MPLLSDYLNFNGVPGTQGPQGFQGEPSVSLVFKGFDTWANIVALPSPDIGDAWELTDPTGAPDSAEGPAVAGDWVIWNGTDWINVGQLDAIPGPQGPQGEQGFGFAFKGTALWSTIANLTGMILNDLWVLVDADPNAPPIDDPEVGPLRPAQVGDAVAFTGVIWENMGPFQGPQGNQGFQGFQGVLGDTGSQGDPGVSDTPGPQGDTGPQGDPAQSFLFKGNDTWANISVLPSPAQNDAWSLTDATGAPNSPYGPAAAGDIVVWNGTAWINIGPIQGPQGAVGAQGPQGFQGAVGADSVVAGPQGSQGNAGAAGGVGPEGPQGGDGTDGNQGNQGFQGVPGSGTVGPQGDPGPQGNDGAKGNTGSQGSPGIPGSTGLEGDEGPQGPQGTQGFQGEGTDIPMYAVAVNLTASGFSVSGSVLATVFGDLVTVTGSITLSGSSSSTSQFTLSGLPFTANQNTGFSANPNNVDIGTNEPSAPIGIMFTLSGTSMRLEAIGKVGNNGIVKYLNVKNGATFELNFSYNSSATNVAAPALNGWPAYTPSP